MKYLRVCQEVRADLEQLENGEFRNELQRMRSVVQLQPGERRGCIGCHENRKSTPPLQPMIAAQRPPSALETPPWGAEPFSYEKVVQSAP